PFLGRLVSPRQPQRHAEISRQFTLRGIGGTNMNAVRLLSGGEYILLKNATLECWNIQQARLVWSHETNGPDPWLMQFGAEVVDGGDSVNIIICEGRTSGVDGQRGSLIQIVNLNLHTGISTSLLADLYPDATSEDFGIMEAKFCGNLACLIWVFLTRSDGTGPQNYCILMDWQTRSRLKLAPNPLTSPISVNLIPNHVLLMTNDGLSGIPEISLINMAPLSPHWRHTTDDSTLDTVHPSELEAIVHESITSCPPESRGRKRELCAYESPLEEGTYRICYLQLFTANLDRHQVIGSYSLSLPNGLQDGATLRQRSVQITDHTGDSVKLGRGVSYSGHNLPRHYGPQNFHSISHPGNPHQTVVLDLPEATPRRIHISVYTGGLTYSSDDSVIVTYFK
ncbi:hypothetical protein DFH07DRAFT_981031, partial [Mycena maculata]